MLNEDNLLLHHFQSKYVAEESTGVMWLHETPSTAAAAGELVPWIVGRLVEIHNF